MMLDVAADAIDIRHLHDQTAALQKDLEQAFARLAEGLPPVGDELAVLHAALSACASESSESSLLPRLSALRSTGHDLSSVARASLGADQQVAHWSGALQQSTETLGTGLAQVVELSSTLRLAALNASAAAARAGAKAAGFSVLTRELGAVAKRSADAVPEMRTDTSTMRELSAEILATQSHLHGKMEVFAGQSHRIDEAIDASVASLSGLRSAIAVSRARAAASAEPIGAIMVAAQRQDIVRQKLGHVLLALEELESVLVASRTEKSDPQEGVRRSDVFRFQRRVGRLCARLLKDIGKDLEGLLDDVSAGLRLLDAASSSFSALRELVPDGGVLRSRLTAPAAVLRQVQDSFGPIADLIAQQGAAADRIPSLTERIGKHLNEFAELTLLLSSINVLVKIEVSRSSILTSQVTLSDDLSRLQRDYVGVTRSTAEELPEVARAASALSKASNRLREIRADLARIDAEVKDTVDGLHAAAMAFIDAFERSMVTAHRLAQQSAHFMRSVDALRESVSCGKRIAEDLERLARGADLTPGEMQPGPSDDELQQRLEGLVDRFTVASHKAAAKDLAGAEVCSGDEPGTLTLF